MIYSQPFVLNMIIDEHFTSYINSLEADRIPWLQQLREEAESENVPIIRREMEAFIRVLLQLKKPENILEIGSGVGYSALFFKTVAADAHITTIENYEPRIKAAEENFSKFSDGSIRLIQGDAVKIISEMEGGFDFIFLDAAKAQYIVMLPDIIRLLNKDGILLADNILQDGELIRSRYALSRRQRTIHERMREFVYEVKHSDELSSSLLTVADGVILSVKL